ncbi:MAG: DUF4157 domain-containing protein, partial [Chloroflexota bacterium]
VVYDEKGKVRPKPTQEAAAPQKDNSPLTLAQIQGKLDASTVTRMQRTLGNAAVQRVLAQRSGGGPTEIDEETAAAINSERGSGQTLDAHIAGKAGAVMGQDFSGVNVHTDSQADSLSRALGATAFTTGNDVFFRSGAYQPTTSEGQRLVSHELTHVVQQGASTPAVQGKMTVNDPHDQYEAEADAVANQVMNFPEEAVPAGRHEEEGDIVRRQEMPEEEEEMTMASRQEMPEEEEELV